MSNKELISIRWLTATLVLLDKAPPLSGLVDSLSQRTARGPLQRTYPLPWALQLDQRFHLQPRRGWQRVHVRVTAFYAF
jgi:hypothetical protein